MLPPQTAYVGLSGEDHPLSRVSTGLIHSAHEFHEVTRLGWDLLGSQRRPSQVAPWQQAEEPQVSRRLCAREVTRPASDVTSEYLTTKCKYWKKVRRYCSISTYL